MGDQTSNTMNFDLNLDPYPSSSDDESSTTVPVTSEEAASINRLHIMRARQSLRLALRHLPLSRYNALETADNPSNFNVRDFLVSVSDEGRSSGEEMQVNDAKKEDGSLGKVSDEKANDNEIDFYTCNICLDVATNPVVTCCGHLFCWPCIYCWLNIHSKAKDCPVCKGEVNFKTVTPIIGRGRVGTRESKDKYNVTIPPRPRANRVESLRQTIERSANISFEELLRHVRNIVPLAGEPEPETTGGTTSEMYNLLVRRVLTSRAIRSEQNNVIPSNEVAEGEMENNPPDSSSDDDSPRQPWPVLLQSQSRNRTTTTTNADGAIETYLLDNPTDINHDVPPPSAHIDSFSSVAAVVHSGSGMPDTAMEIDSMMSFSTISSARRRDIDGGDSRPPRRRLY